MTDIELVIKIPEESYKLLKNEGVDWLGAEHILNAVANGTPLQEHGRLCDLDKLIKDIVKAYGVNSIHELPQDIKMFYDKFINSAPTILDATFEYQLRNYTFFRKEKE